MDRLSIQTTNAVSRGARPLAWEVQSNGQSFLFEGWEGCSSLSPIERVWNFSQKKSKAALQSLHPRKEEKSMNINHPPSFDTSPSETQAEVSRKMTLLSTRAIGEPISSKPKRRRHRWSQTVLVERQPLPFEEPASPHILKTKEDESGELTERMLAAWCIVLTISSLIAIAL